MGTRRGLQWPSLKEVFSASQVAAILTDLGIEIKGETDKDFMCFCPFHHNRYSPAFTISKSTGLYYCHNGSCNKRGNMQQLIKDLGRDDANSMISQYRNDAEALNNLRDSLEPFEFQRFTEVDLMALGAQFPQSDGHVYMRGRGFEDDTLRYFDVGFDGEKVIVPFHDPDGMEIGYVGRFVHEKGFRNSEGLPKNKTLFNFHRAKKTGGTVVIVESSFDAMKVHQAGYPNVVALLGSSFSNYHKEQLGKTFDTIINFVDNPLTDEAGAKVAAKIENALSHKSIKYAGIDGHYPEGCKDATDMTDEQIRNCLRHAMDRFRYHSLV